MDKKPFTLTRNRWYAWQMMPGYIGKPYLSPIYVREVKPLKTGKDMLRLQFDNVYYAEGVQDFDLNIKILKRSEEYLVGELVYGGDSDVDRCCIVSKISFDWLQMAFPEYMKNNPLKHGTEGVEAYLSRIYRKE
jgi:hypothetical protein